MTRYQVLGLATVLIITGGCAKKKARQPATTAQARPVVVTQAATRTFEEQLKLSGNIEAKRVAMVAARTGGTLETIHVDEGSAVTAGKTTLFETESVTLREAVIIATQQVAVAKASILERGANQARVQADFDKAKIDYERFQRLFKAGATTKNAVENQESRFKQLQALLNHARTLVDLAREQAKQAQSQLAIAKKNLSDAVVLAPLTGVVTKRNFEPGERVKPGDVVVRIEDHTFLEAVVHVPSIYYARIAEGRTKVDLSIDGARVGSYPVAYKGRNVSADLRTFEVKCRIANPPKNVVPGRLVQATIGFGARQAVGVPADAVQLRGGKTVVFVADGGKAKAVEVQTGLEQGGWLEVTGDLAAGAPIVATGQDFVNDGEAVLVRKEGD